MPLFQPSAEVAERRAQVLQLRIQQVPYQVIAERLGMSSANARSDYHKALKALRAEQDDLAGQARTIELAKLDAAEQAVWRVLRRKHVHVSGGRVVHDDNDQPLEDDGPVLNAVDRLVKIAARRATLMGWDAPARIEVSDATDQAIRALAGELAAGRVGDMESGREDAVAGDPRPGT